MVNRVLLLLAFLVVAFCGFAVGQSQREPLPGGPVFSGNDFGFQADDPLQALLDQGRQPITGRFVVNVKGRWVEVRSRMGVAPAK